MSDPGAEEPGGLAALVGRLQRQSGLLAKRDIQAAARAFPQIGRAHV